MREPEGFAITLSPYHKPSLECMPIDSKSGVIYTPADNGAFINGITRQRGIALMREAAVSVVECTLRYSDILAADESFSSGNYSEVVPINRIDDRALQPGPLYRKARELNSAFAHSRGFKADE